ncbi:hypothetical protein AAH048_12730 [Parabacteroides merdae]|uniref:hypothetical protein n=1 Tax=Parabacteroides merdae TaxID=46503 RepID=UPI0039B694FD
MQLTEKDDGRGVHAAPVGMAERGIGKPPDPALVAHTAVERMVQRTRRMAENDGFRRAVIAPVDFQRSRSGNLALHGHK